jgi:hypothetical protein
MYTRWRDSRVSEPRDAYIYGLAVQVAKVTAGPLSCMMMVLMIMDDDDDDGVFSLQAMMALGFSSDVPFSLLGHSWGAYVALETAVVLKKVYNASPAKLFVLSMMPPKVRTAAVTFLTWLCCIMARPDNPPLGAAADT